MLKSLHKLTGWFSATRAGVRPGLYHYTRSSDGAVVRFHLRVDPAGDGLLLANAAATTRLSPSGVIIAKGILDGDEPAAIVHRVQALFRGAGVQQIAADLTAVEAVIKRMESPGITYPILNLDDPAFSPKVAPLGRPISADVPLCPFPTIQQILDRLWELAIPHVTILAGCEPDRAALREAVERASDLGLITGVRGRGTDLGQSGCIPELAAAGLDHLDVYCLSARDDVHDALTCPGDLRQAVRAMASALKSEVCPVAQIGLVRSTLTTVGETLQVLTSHGIANVGAMAIATADAAQSSSGALLAHELLPAARLVEEAAEQLDLRLLWYPTVQFDPTRPLGDQVCRGPRCSGDTAIRVEPDGSVIPPRGPRRSAGNLLAEAWETIEQNEVYAYYRRRVESDTHCDECPGLAICAADCPRDPAGWATGE